jgi:hypothetical protein
VRLILFLATLIPVAIVLAPGASATPMQIAVLQALDKITARVSTIEAPINSTVQFGTLQITARHCDKRPPEETPESAAFLEIVEVKPDEEPTERFTGWMFASSPALSALEHPVYDLWVIDCKNASTSDSETSE